MKKSDFLLGLLVAIIWGANFSVIKLGLNTLDPFLLTAFRFLFCAFPLIFFVKRPTIPLPIVALYGVLFGVGLWGIVNLSIVSGLSAGIASLLLQFTAFITIIMSFFFFKERISIIQYAGMTIAFTGLVFITSLTDGNISSIGVALVLCAAFAWGFCNMLLKKYKPNDMLSFVIWSGFFATIPLFAITFIIKGELPFIMLPQNLNSIAIFSIGFQSYITTILGYWIWNNLIKKYPATSVAPLSLFVPISGLATSSIIFNEVVSIEKMAAAMIILIGISIVLFSKKISSLSILKPLLTKA